MSIFSTILEKLGIGHAKAEPDTSTLQLPEAPTSDHSQPPIQAGKAPPIQAPPRQFDIVAKLDTLAAASAQKLNWKTSIVDLLKLLGLDSSFDARKKLAVELACPQDKLGDSASMNIWLHKTVLQKLADNGGNIPRELL